LEQPSLSFFFTYLLNFFDFELLVRFDFVVKKSDKLRLWGVGGDPGPGGAGEEAPAQGGRKAAFWVRTRRRVTGPPHAGDSENRRLGEEEAVWLKALRGGLNGERLLKIIEIRLEVSKHHGSQEKHYQNFRYTDRRG
jgi:hypothetical protein